MSFLLSYLQLLNFCFLPQQKANKSYSMSIIFILLVKEKKMRFKVFLALILCLAFLFSSLAQAQPDRPSDNTKKEAKIVDPPNDMKKAKELFLIALALEKEQKYDDAFVYYNAVIVFFQKLPNNEGNTYVMAVLNNMAGIFVNQGKYTEAISLFKAALDLAVKADNYRAMAEYSHKLGIIFSQFAIWEAQKAQMTNVITPDGKKLAQLQRIMLTKGTYTRMAQVEDEFIDDRIRLLGTQNPFTRQNDLYTKLVNIKITSEFNPEEKLTPDNISFTITINKEGYFPNNKKITVLPKTEYTEINEKLSARPRQVEAIITEDFYRSGPIAPEEMTLSLIEEKEIGKAISITKDEKFRPGYYSLVIKQRGYDPIIEQIAIHPGEGVFSFKRELKSSLRSLTYNIQSELTTVGSGQIIPDEITLNHQPVVAENCKVKPGEYTLVINKEGYESIVRREVIYPKDMGHELKAIMKPLLRKVIFQITGDYEPSEPLVPDAVTFNDRTIQNGDELLPNTYRCTIQKKGYDTDRDILNIEPKKDPYILVKQLISIPRRVRREITAEEPEKIVINNLEVCTLSNRDTQTETFKPGIHNLVIKAAGYEPINKKIKIPPGDTDFLLKEVLQPKLVKVETYITQDIAHDDPNTKPTITLKNNKNGQERELKYGDLIPPEVYTLTVKMDGYEPQVSELNIKPDELPLKVERRLEAAQRPVITDITAEYPDGPISPDQIKLDGKDIPKQFKIKPGTKGLIITKEGYNQIDKQIKIGANSTPFILAERLETKPRVVTFIFRDMYSRRELVPDEKIFNKNTLLGNTIIIKPGAYHLKASLNGYFPIDETVTIPVGAQSSYELEMLMIPQERAITTYITGDFEPGKRLIPDVIKLTEVSKPIQVDLLQKDKVAPGSYVLEIKKEGYDAVQARLDISADKNPYEIRRILISSPRKVVYDITSKFDNEKLAPDSLLFNGQPIKDGQEVKPNPYSLLIKKAGYNQIIDQLSVEPSAQPYVLKKQLDPLPVVVLYDIKGDDEKQTPLLPDLIQLNDKFVDQKAAFLPTQYKLVIEKIGFNKIEENLVIKPSDKPYTISKIMESLPRAIELAIVGDSTPDLPFIPEVITLNGIDAGHSDNKFKPRKYQMDILHAGYFPVREEITIPPGENAFLISKVLETKPRRFESKVTYDVAPPDPGDPEIAFIPVTGKGGFIKAGDMIKPGEYTFKLKKYAYEDIELRRSVVPDETPFVLDREMIAKKVVLNINIVHDIEPPTNLAPFTVSLIDKITMIPSSVQNGNRIKPGSFWLDVQRPGYTFGGRQDFEIRPSEEPQLINKTLKAKPRSISFNIMNEDGIMIEAFEILVNGQKIDYQKSFQPGTELDLVAKFKKYKTVQQRITIVPGEGPYVAQIPLKLLVPYEFVLSRNEEVLDNIKYPYIFYADSQPIEPQHTEAEKSSGSTRTYYTVNVDPTARNLRVFAGYLFTQKKLTELRTGVGVFTNISVDNLIEHLKQKVRNEGNNPAAIIPTMERIISAREISKLRQCAAAEIDQIIRHIQTLRFSGSDMVRVQKIMDTLEKLK